MYGVFVSGGSYTGSGPKSRVFTPEEEKKVAKKALEKTNEGKDLTWSFLRQIMVEEVELLMSKDPTRVRSTISTIDGSLLNMSFVRRFAKRNGLSKYLLQKFTILERPYECEVCEKTFSFKNALVKHMKSQHKKPDL